MSASWEMTATCESGHVLKSGCSNTSQDWMDSYLYFILKDGRCPNCNAPILTATYKPTEAKDLPPTPARQTPHVEPHPAT
jgi:hypothetical protein